MGALHPSHCTELHAVLSKVLLNCCCIWLHHNITSHYKLLIPVETLARHGEQIRAEGAVGRVECG